MITSRRVSLKRYNSFGTDNIADTMIFLSSEKDASLLFSSARVMDGPLFILGEGSNVLFVDDYKGTVIRPVLEGINVEGSSGSEVLVSVGAGEKWDTFVEWSVKNGLGGLENLSLIPGTAGATPVQNIGAYGVEVSEAIKRVEAIRISDGSCHTFTKAECGFGYRTSVFKRELKGEYLITRVYYILSSKPSFRLDYQSIKEELEETGKINLANIRRAVIDVRRRKLPDPETTGNAGSFFKNPVVSESLAGELTVRFPGLPVYDDKPGYKKIAAAWLIEQCGWKGSRKGDAGVYNKQALVLVNHGKASGRDIYNFSEEIRQSVEQKFNILLEHEVEIIGTI
jgi:UDP-N-acetylmuramate dehydrogenase